MHERKNNSLAAKTKKATNKNKNSKMNKLEVSNNNNNRIDTEKNIAVTESSLLGTNKNNNNNNNKIDKNKDPELDVNGKLSESDLLDTPTKQNPKFDWIVDYIFIKQYYIIHLIFNSILNLAIAILVIISIKNIIDDIVSYYSFNIRSIQIINMNLMSFSMYLLNIGMTTKYYSIDNNANNDLKDTNANTIRSEDILYLSDLLKDHLQYLESSSEIINEKVVKYYFSNLISYGNDFQGFKNFSYPVFSDYTLYLNKSSYTTTTTYSIASDIILKEKYISKNIDNNLLSYFLHIAEQDKNKAFQIEKNPLFYNNVVTKFSSFYSYITNMYSLFCSSYLNLILTSYNYLTSIDSTIALEINAFSILLFLMLAINFGYLLVIKLCCNKINNEFINIIEINNSKITNKSIYLTKALNSIEKYSFEEIQHIESLVKINTCLSGNNNLLQNQNSIQLENIIEEPNDLDLSENKEVTEKNKAHYLNFLKKKKNDNNKTDNLNNKLLNTVNNNANKKIKNALSISSQADLIPVNTKRFEADLTTEVKTKSFSDIYHFPPKLLFIMIVFILMYLICLIIFLSVSLLYLNTKSDKFKENITLNYSFLSQVFSSSYLLQTYFPKFDIGDFTYTKNDFINHDYDIDSTAYYNNAYFLKDYVEKSIEFYKFDNNTLPQDYVNYVYLEKFNISSYFSIIQNEIFQTLDNSVSYDNSNSERISRLTLNQKNNYAKNFNLRSLVSNSICNIKEFNEIISEMAEEYDELIQATFNAKSIEFINGIYSFYNLCDGSSDNKNIDSFSYFIMNNYLNELLITTKKKKNTNYSKESNYISDKYEIKNNMIFLATSYSYYQSSTFISYKYITNRLNMYKQLLIAIDLLILFSSFTINIIIAYFFYKSRNKVSKYKKYILISNNIN